MRLRARALVCLCVLSFLAAFSTTTFAAVHTSAAPKVRVTAPVDSTKRTTLYGHVPGAARRANDLGHVDPTTRSERMIMVLKSDEQQKRELRRVIDEQQDKHTTNYHQWVTPEQFGEHFGVHDSDIGQVKAWLESQGFSVDEVSKSKRVIRFSGTTGQVENAFQTEMHYFLTPNGEMHVSNSREISVPEALAPVIAGVPTLNDFFRKSHMVGVGRMSRMKLGPKPHYSNSTNCAQTGEGAGDGNNCYFGPGDFATVYNTAPLLASGINGTGVTIGIVGRSDILMSDVETYRQMFNLPVNDPIFTHAGQDNGIQAGDDGESDLDVEISGGVAPAATVNFVIGTPTFLVDGITNSMQYIVENNAADIMSTSYGDCESNEGAGGNAFNSQLFEQAAAQGISVFVADGDNGAAECDDQSADAYEVLGYAASAEGSTPYNVSVGGSEFDEGSNTGYWSSPANNNPLSQASALSYIPEVPWNEAKNSTYDPIDEDLGDLWAGSGGISAYYIQPAWQQGSGVPTSDPILTQGGDWLIVNITNVGSGYTTAPSVTFSGETCVSNPVAASTTISGGQVTSVVYNDGTQGGTLRTGQGFGCTVAGAVTFAAAPAGGTTATGTVVLAQMQNLLPLVSNVAHRFTPDVSLNAASDHDGTIFCSEGVCEIGSGGVMEDWGIVGGTSVAAPSMAGVQALINQAAGGRQGMPGYIYYTLANNQYVNNPGACNSSTPPASNSQCAFQDITTGNNQICGTSACSGTTGKMGFTAVTGYDMATGLGSPNVANLANQWSSVTFNSSTTTLNLSQTSFAHGTPITLSGTVTGSGTPTGDVAFIVTQGAIGDTVNQTTGALNGPVAFATLSGGNYSAMLNNLPGGTYNVTARYGGDDTYGSSYSAAVPVTVTSEGSALTITPYALSGSACTITPGSSLTPTPNSFAYASNVLININVAGVSGAGSATGTVTISDNGTPIASNLTLDPNGDAFLLSGPIPSSSCIYEYNFANIPTLAVGSHSLTATYSGDPSLGTTTAGPVSLTVTKITPTLTVAAGGTQITSGFSDPLTATFSLSALTGGSIGTLAPTGTVTFKDTTTSTTLGTANVVSTGVTTINAQSTAFVAVAGPLSATGITSPPTGNHSITATYSGDANFATATSTAATVAVGTFTTATTTTVTNAGTLTVGNPSALGARPTFTATIGVASGTAPTSGTVTFYDTTSTNNLGYQPAGTYVLGTGTVGSSHTATFRLAAGTDFGGGTHSITATYGGVVTTFGPSTSATPYVETVTQGTLTNVLSAKTVGKSGQAYYFTSVLTPSATNAAFQPGANVQFFDACANCSPSYGATSLGTAAPYSISSGNGGYGLYEANLSVNTLPVGTHTITAQYVGDANYPATTSNAQSVFVGGTPTLTWNTPTAITYGTALSATQLNATNSIPGTYVYSPPLGTVLNAGSQSLSVTFTAADYTDFPTPQTTGVTLQVNPATTTVVWSNPAPIAYGTPLGATQLNASATPVSAGNYAYNPAAGAILSPGSQPLAVTFTPSNTNYASSNGSATLSVAKAITSIAVTSVNPASEDYGSTAPVTITAVLSWSGSGVAPTANVTIGGNSTGTYGATSCGAPSGNTLTCSATLTPSGSDLPGSYTETAAFSGDTNYNASSSGATSNFTINSATSTTTVGSTPNPSTYATSVTFTATINGENGQVRRNNRKGAVKPQIVTGTVAWSSNTGCGTTPVTSGTPGIATCTTSSATHLPVGTDVVTATYSGDSNHGGSSGSVNQVVQGGIATTINVTSVSPSAEDFAQDAPVTITAVLSWVGNGVAPTGADVTISGTGNGTYGATSCAARVHETITCTATYTPTNADVPGAYTESAAFSGDTNYSASSSSQTNNFTINNATSTTTVATSGSPSVFGQPVTFTATINGEYGDVTGRRGATKKNGVKSQDVSGTVAWSSNTGCGTTPVTSGNPGTATCTTSSLPLGTDTITANYSGDGDHGTSTGTLSGGQVVQNAATSISVTSVSPSNEDYGLDAPVTITAVLTWTGSGTPPTASAVTIGGNGPSGSYGTTSCGAPSSDTMTCTNTYTPSGADTAGTYTETAAFSGDSNYGPSSSTQSNNFTINQASSTTSVSSGTNPSTYGQSVTFTATVSGENGQVTSRSRGGRGVKPQVVGGTVVWSPNTGCGTTNVTSGVATCTTSSLAGGTDAITATYQGDGNHGGSSGTLAGGQVVHKATQTITVSTPAPSTATLGSSFTIVASSSSSLPITFTSVGGCTNSDGTYTMAASGTKVCTEKMNAAGNGNYLDAPQVSESTSVAKPITPTVSFTGAPATATYNSNFTVSASSNSSSIPTLTATGPCTISGTVVTMTSGTGTCAMTATWAANDTYTKATATQHTTAEKATSVITWSNPAPITYGTPLSATQLNASANTSGTYLYTPAAGKVLTAGLQSLSVKFTPSVATDYTTVTYDVSITVNPVNTTTSITSNTPNPSATGKAVTIDFSVAAASGSGKRTGSVTVNASTSESCTGTVSAAGTGHCSITFTSTGSRTLTASYPGDGNNNSSTSAPVTQSVN